MNIFSMRSVVLSLCLAMSLAACEKAEEPAVDPDVAAEANAPAPKGDAVLRVVFEVPTEDQSQVVRVQNASAAPPQYREPFEKVANDFVATPGKIMLLTPYFEAKNEFNDIELARTRARAVINAVTGLGVPMDKVILGKPVALPKGSADATTVDIRIQ